MLEKISSQIKKFERIYNGIEEAFINVADIKKSKSGFFCTITVYSDDLLSKTVYQNIFYPLRILKLT